MIKGIDVSQYQGMIDWQKAIDAGVQFAIIRIGIGNDIKSQDDKRAIRNMGECERLGIPYGVYIYSYALNEDNVHSESAHMYRMIKNRKPTLGVWFDMEDADSYKRNNNLNPYKHKELMTQFCILFMQDMKTYGFNNVGVYASYDYFKNILDVARIKSIGKIWLAHWGINEPSMECAIWQYADNGKVKGITGNVDMDYFYGAIERPSHSQDTVQYFQSYTGSLPLSAALNYIGADGSYTNRVKIADANGIVDYRGTFTQNIKMLNLLKSGNLIKP